MFRGNGVYNLVSYFGLPFCSWCVLFASLVASHIFLLPLSAGASKFPLRLIVNKCKPQLKYCGHSQLKNSISRISVNNNYFMGSASDAIVLRGIAMFLNR